VESTYEVQDGGAIIRVALGEFPRLLEIARSVVPHRALGPRIRFLIDLRSAGMSLDYEDIRRQADGLAAVAAVASSRWALLTTSDFTLRSGAQTFATLARLRNMSVRVFDDEGEAMAWLQRRRHRVPSWLPVPTMRPPSCPRCGSRQNRISRRTAPLTHRLLGFRSFRCLSCLRRFVAWRPWAVRQEE
jgi:hypothetical protein